VRGLIFASVSPPANHPIDTITDRLFLIMLDLLAAATGAADAPPAWITWAPIVGMILIFWFLIIRPQMKQHKAHQAKVAGLKRGDQVVTAGGLVAKVVKVEDHYAELELAKGVKVRAVKSTIGDVIAPETAPPAND
jgi:preprotein translocase subunit YajC